MSHYLYITFCFPHTCIYTTDCAGQNVTSRAIKPLAAVAIIIGDVSTLIVWQIGVIGFRYRYTGISGGLIPCSSFSVSLDLLITAVIFRPRLRQHKVGPTFLSFERCPKPPSLFGGVFSVETKAQVMYVPSTLPESLFTARYFLPWQEL